MIRPFLVYGVYRSDVDIMDEKKIRMDVFYPAINYFYVVLDNKYPWTDIYYPVKHRKCIITR